MAILSYTSEEPLNREAKNISFDIPDDMNIHEFKIMCVRLASSIGYQPNSINKAFGETTDDTQLNNDFKSLLQTINQLTGSLV